MATNTKIQWATHTFNPWRGCRKVSEECANCYIVTTVPFRTTGQTHGSVRVRAGSGTLAEPLLWNKKAARDAQSYAGNPMQARFDGRPYMRPRVFCLSLGDWLDDENVPAEWVAALLKTIQDTPKLDWLLLTKRPQNWEQRMSAALAVSDEGALRIAYEWLGCLNPPPNVWFGVSVGADQKAALNIPAKIHFLSVEPMLRPLDLRYVAHFNWVILGGESGPNARPVDIEWVKEAVSDCQKLQVPVFVKQLGKSYYEFEGSQKKRIFLDDKKGGEPAEWPEELRVREFPNVS